MITEEILAETEEVILGNTGVLQESCQGSAVPQEQWQQAAWFVLLQKACTHGPALCLSVSPPSSLLGVQTGYSHPDRRAGSLQIPFRFRENQQCWGGTQ